MFHSSMLENSTETVDAMPDNEPGLDRSQPTWVVDWDGPDDQENPHNWSTKFKLVVSLVLVILPLIVNIGSSIMGGSLALLEREFHIGSEVAILTTTTMFLMASPLLINVPQNLNIELRANIRPFSCIGFCHRPTHFRPII
jgi:hypothetical protein